jgi:exopolysaccharide production protein ExoQ
MHRHLALVISLLFVFYLFIFDRRITRNLSFALWIPWLWIFFISSRSLSLWINLGSPVQLTYNLEGSPIDRLLFTVLILFGIFILYYRKINWLEILSDNIWIALYFIYCTISIFWSDFPFVSTKRLIKAVGELIMILVIITSVNPWESTKAVFRRCGYIVIPISIIFIKYYPEFGRTYSRFTGEVMYTGITLHKNHLGYVLIVVGLFLFQDLLELRQKYSTLWIKHKETRIYLFLFLMLLWLLYMAQSSTSNACFILGCLSIFLTGKTFIRKNMGTYFITAIFLFMILHLTVDFTVIIIESLGRDITLTGRTELWTDLISIQNNQWIGSGFETFWLKNFNHPLWEKFSWQPNSAHNGFLEVYLQLGYFGLFLILALIFNTYKICRVRLIDQFIDSRYKISFFFIFILYNFTEAGFRGLHLMWFVFLLVSFNYNFQTKKRCS